MSSKPRRRAFGHIQRCVRVSALCRRKGGGEAGWYDDHVSRYANLPKTTTLAKGISEPSASGGHIDTMLNP